MIKYTIVPCRRTALFSAIFDLASSLMLYSWTTAALLISLAPQGAAQCSKFPSGRRVLLPVLSTIDMVDDWMFLVTGVENNC
ncbi:hypothetical protein V8F33_007796 [Rhypophila sp. PSN 637]